MNRASNSQGSKEGRHGDGDAIERVNEANRLWPPIADALDTFLKRRASGADAYERTWRLIHVWESIVLSLSAAATARAASLPEEASLFLRCRELQHGRRWSDSTRSFEHSQGALDGSMNRRIDILWEIGSRAASASPFLSSLRAFLLERAIDLRDLTREWSSVCEVPADARRADRFTVREALRHVNTLRNRFAHVPFPYDRLEGLAQSLQGVTEQLMTVAPAPWEHPKTGVQNPLTGALGCRGRTLVGSLHKADSTVGAKEFVFIFGHRRSDSAERWPGHLFVHVDSLFRPYLLTRLIADATSTCEYTRFRAEANAVITIEDAGWEALLPRPQEADYSEPERGTTVAPRSDPLPRQPVGPSPTIAMTLAEATRLTQNEDFERAIPLLEQIVLAEPDNAAVWHTLGYAEREYAMRTRTREPEVAKAYFLRSIERLTKALSMETADDRRADALLARSRARFQYARVAGDDQQLRGAMQDAEQAYAANPDTKYESWLEFVRSTG